MMKFSDYKNHLVIIQCFQQVWEMLMSTDHTSDSKVKGYMHKSSAVFLSSFLIYYSQYLAYYSTYYQLSKIYNYSNYMIRI